MRRKNVIALEIIVISFISRIPFVSICPNYKVYEAVKILINLCYINYNIHFDILINSTRNTVLDDLPRTLLECDNIIYMQLHHFM